MIHSKDKNNRILEYSKKLYWFILWTGQAPSRHIQKEFCTESKLFLLVFSFAFHLILDDYMSAHSEFRVFLNLITLETWDGFTASPCLVAAWDSYISSSSSFLPPISFLFLTIASSSTFSHPLWCTIPIFGHIKDICFEEI